MGAPMIKISNGAEAREWRERLGLTVMQVASRCDLTTQSVEYAETWYVHRWQRSDCYAERITAALTVEYQRQAREALEDDMLLTWAKRFRPDLGDVWDATPADSQEEAVAREAILAALREAAGEPARKVYAANEVTITMNGNELRQAAGPQPARVVGVDLASEPDRTVVSVVTSATTLTEPVAPSGIASVRWNGDTLHCEMSGLFFAFIADNADLYEWVAKRIRYEQARDASKAARLAAVDEAQRAYDAADGVVKRAMDERESKREALAKAKREAGL